MRLKKSLSIYQELAVFLYNDLVFSQLSNSNSLLSNFTWTVDLGTSGTAICYLNYLTNFRVAFSVSSSAISTFSSTSQSAL